MSGMFPYFFKAAVLGLQELYPKGHSGTVFLYDCWTVRLVIFPFGSVGDAVLGDSNRVNRNAFHTTHGACVAGLSQNHNYASQCEHFTYCSRMTHTIIKCILKYVN